MRSNYRKIGDFIQLVDERNRDLKVEKLVGLSISKEFIPSVANTTGTDMSKYKVIRKGQFACSVMQVRRDKKMPVALMTEFDEAIISQAYPVFEVKNENELLPEYLMMWFSRSEFDRHACFLAVGGVRGSLEWEDFLEMELPIPSIEKQRAIVAEYNTVVNRIQLNEQLNEKLEATAQAIYKQWFVDFEFPNEDGKPFKSSGGKMVYNEELDKEIPEGWEVMELQEVCSRITDGSHASPPSVEIGYPMASVKDMKDFKLELGSCRRIAEEDYIQLVNNDCKPKEGDILIAKDGSYLKYIFPIQEEENVVILSSIAIIRPNELFDSFLLTQYFKLPEILRRMENIVSGGAIQRIVLKEFRKFKVLVPRSMTQKKAALKIRPLMKQTFLRSKENELNEEILDVLLAKMTKV